MSKTYSVCPQCGALNGVDTQTLKSKKPVCGKCATELPMQHGVNHLDDRGLSRLIEKSPLPVVVDFWAPWCGPCRSFAPVFDQTADQLAAQVVFVKLNTDEHQQSGAKFQVRGIPTMIVFKNGSEVDRISGALPPQQFKQWLQQSAGI